MTYSRNYIENLSKETCFNKGNIEKVIRLLDVLIFIFEKSSFKEKVILKGGTAINLVYTNLKRLSVDIDLDYQGSLDKKETKIDREQILEEIDNYMKSEGYIISSKCRGSLILSSRVFKYNSSNGNIDSIKIEINFIDRISLHPINNTLIKYFNKQVTIKTPIKEELFAMKLTALIDRSKPRDLYDSMFLVNNEETFDKNKLKKSLVFYLSLDDIYDINELTFKKIRTIGKIDIKTELLPVLKKNEKFDLQLSVDKIITFLKELLDLDEKERGYLESFKNGLYEPLLLFNDLTCLNANKHPMAKWKIQNIL